ncbi:SDR family NAD(P)-dependent oxidoreductase [Coralliovum pocilloporae]|uniref:SDR family NAD(P)-dependent oxidoreductase n=1 Tax=Coralliovum pocilloporae TaxID=3066369 RepID=UPI003307A8A4
MSKTTMPWSTVWVIGASSGIGEAFARHCHRNGLSVIVSARRADALWSMANDLPGLQVVPMDVSSGQSVDIAIQALKDQNLVPDLVVFCAGTYEPGGLTILDADAASDHMNINYIGAIRVIQAVMPIFRDRGTGHLALVSSLTGYRGLPNAVHYGPTKAALINLTETLYPEFERLGLDLTIINPGFVKTPMTDKNTFEMPFLISAAEAADHMWEGLRRKQFEIAFPAPLVRRLKALRLLPYRLYFRVMRSML